MMTSETMETYDTPGMQTQPAPMQEKTKGRLGLWFYWAGKNLKTLGEYIFTISNIVFLSFAFMHWRNDVGADKTATAMNRDKAHSYEASQIRAFVKTCQNADEMSDAIVMQYWAIRAMGPGR